MDYSILQSAVVVVGYLLAFATSVRIVLQRREPTATLAWVLSVVLLPYLGVMLYVLIGRKRLDRQLRRRRAHADALESRLPEHLGASDPPPPALEGVLASPDSVLVRLSSRIGCRWPTIGNRADVLIDAERTYLELERAIEQAEHHVHFQFYIYQRDRTGQRFRELLTRKAQAGVEVRVLVDGVGSFGLESFMQPFVRAGGRYAEFLPVGRLSRHWHPNLRNHRKVVVVDGRVGFTGGINIGDEYPGREADAAGPWRDTHLRLEGPAVSHLQEIFAEDWYFATREQPDEKSWFPPLEAAGDALVHVVSSGPDTVTEPIQRIFFAAVNDARERLYLTTPYFVPDQALIVALETAALRGVDVRLLLPAKSDSLLVLHAGRSYYDQLLTYGVRIFEYQSRVLHAKTMLVDDRWATVGSANMDMRSFRLNFEVNAAIYGAECADQLARLFHHDLRHAREVTLADVDGKPLNQRMAESLARIVSPLL